MMLLKLVAVSLLFSSLPNPVIVEGVALLLACTSKYSAHAGYTTIPAALLRCFGDGCSRSCRCGRRGCLAGSLDHLRRSRSACVTGVHEALDHVEKRGGGTQICGGEETDDQFLGCNLLLCHSVYSFLVLDGLLTLRFRVYYFLSDPILTGRNLVPKLAVSWLQSRAPKTVDPYKRSPESRSWLRSQRGLQNRPSGSC